MNSIILEDIHLAFPLMAGENENRLSLSSIPAAMSWMFEVNSILIVALSEIMPPEYAFTYVANSLLGALLLPKRLQETVENIIVNKDNRAMATLGNLFIIGLFSVSQI
jgi:hypothetical protein